LIGGSGNDVLNGSTGDNSMSDGFGNDRIDFTSNSVAAILTTGGGNDTVKGSMFNDSLTGSSGADVIDGWLGNDTLNGGAGNDSLSGNVGDDRVNGGSGADQLDGADGIDRLDGGADNDRLNGGFGDDTVLGGSGRDDLAGDYGNDSVDGGTGRDTIDGGAGDADMLFADQGNETLKNGEHVEITVPDGSAQTDGWSCGPNSGSRLLRSYGYNVSYSQLRADAQQSNIISDYGLGTPPPSLREIIGKYKPGTQLQSGADFNSILARLGEGRPVVALIGWGSVPVPSPIPFVFVDLAPEALHYICLTGFDMASDTLYYMDTNGVSKQMSFTEFQDKWDWTATGAVYGFMYGLGIRKQTMIW
jgi:RTX calcium-binding nonapeptide repeat (4 copies)/Peptidase_C39 like family